MNTGKPVPNAVPCESCMIFGLSCLMIGGTCCQCNDLGKVCVPVTDVLKIINSEEFHLNAAIRSYHISVRIAANEAGVGQLRDYVQGTNPSISARLRTLEECVRTQAVMIGRLKQQIEEPPTMQTLGYPPIQQNDSRSNGDM